MQRIPTLLSQLILVMSMGLVPSHVFANKGASKEDKAKAEALIKEKLGGLMQLMCQQNPNQEGCESLRKDQGLKKAVRSGERYVYKGTVYVRVSEAKNELKPFSYTLKVNGIPMGKKSGAAIDYSIGDIKGKAKSVHNGFDIINLKGLSQDALKGIEKKPFIVKQKHASVFGILAIVAGAGGMSPVDLAKAVKLKASQDPNIAAKFSSTKLAGVKATRYQDDGVDIIYSEALSLELMKTKMLVGEKGEANTVELVSYSK
ncbi:MAG: hypothetical protein HRU19_15950 [Pseudobacteriovorax sp.]|nr:hypothetical protein [Pseudobacteriovorax sp.]